MIVRERSCMRQLSLDIPAKASLRRQASEELRPVPLRIAWGIDPSPVVNPQTGNVEVVAKKCGQPKPTMIKSPKSIFSPDQNTVLFSRQQLTERLRSSWKKKSGRHNLNIFLHNSAESEFEAHETTKSVDSESDMSESDDASPEKEPPSPVPEKEKLNASERRMNFRMAGRQKVVESSPCSTPEPKKPLQRMMSAPTRATPMKFIKAPSEDNQRVKSAPIKRKTKSPSKRKTKDKDEKEIKKGSRRGVERGEVVTMVSLVSPAESDSDEPICIQIPPSPKPLTPPSTPKEEPKIQPPVICLRKAPKAVNFRPSGLIADRTTGTHFQTNYTLKRQQSTPCSTPIQPALTSKLGNSRAGLQRQMSVGNRENVPQPPPQTPLTHTTVGPGFALAPVLPTTTIKNQNLPMSNTNQRPPTPAVPPPLSKPTAPLGARRKLLQPSPAILKIDHIIERAKSSGKSETIEETKHEILTEDETKLIEPEFKNEKEKECWNLFKKMSDRGVSVSFETVLRGLLTPTEYRIRRAALLSFC